MMTAGDIAMKQLMERAADRKSGRNEEENRQQPRERWFRHPT
jgi:hypothetical protein